MATTLKTHKPSGSVPWPTILLEGEEKSGKSYAAAAFSGDERVGRSFFLELGQEGCAEQYGAVPGADYEVIEHDGTWRSIMASVDAVREIAQAANDAGAPPVLLVVDTMTAEWKMLTEWADTRARRMSSNRKLLDRDPDAEINISPNYWNDSNKRHDRLMAKLLTMPAIVVLTARNKLVAEMVNGKPREGAPKVWTLDAQKSIGYGVHAWVRLFRNEDAEIVGLRSVHHDMRPGKREPQRAPQFTLGWLVFDVLKCDPRTAQVRDLKTLDADQADEDETAARPQQAAAAQDTPQAPPQEQAPVQQVPRSPWTRINELVAHLQVQGTDVMVLACEVVGRAVASGKEFTADEVAKLAAGLEDLAGADGSDAVVAQMIEQGRARQQEATPEAKVA